MVRVIKPSDTTNPLKQWLRAAIHLPDRKRRHDRELDCQESFTTSFALQPAFEKIACLRNNGKHCTDHQSANAP